MKPTTAFDRIETYDAAICGCIAAAHDEACMLWASNSDVAAMPELEFSGFVTQLAKVKLSRVEGIVKLRGPSALYRAADADGGVVFRIHRGQLRGKADPQDFDAEDLLSPTGNGITVNSKQPDVLVLWASDSRQLRGIFVVMPREAPESVDGSQFAAYPQLNGKRWRASRRLHWTAAAAAAATRVENIVVASVEPVVDLGLAKEHGTPIANVKQAEEGKVNQAKKTQGG